MSKNWILGGLCLGVLLAPNMVKAQENWTLQSPATKPATQSYNAIAYDAGNQNIVYFGGEAKTWIWDGLNWTAYTPSPAPSTRQGHVMAYDATNSRVVLFGGYDIATGIELNDTWVWNGATKTWAKLSPATSPPPLFGAAAAFDAVLGNVVLFGGDNGTSATNDTWTWSGTTWTKRSPTTSPSIRQDHRMVYDAARQRILLFGGATFSNGFNSFADTWSWNGATLNWTALSPANSPPDRYNYAMAYDASQSQVVIFGGVANHNNDCANDTWAWNGVTWTQLNPTTVPPCVEAIPMEYDAAVGQIVLPATIFTSDTWYFGTSTTTAVTINVPSGVTFSFNGVSHTGTQTINIAPGSYTLAVTSPQSAGAGTQAIFQSWSDSGTQSHSVTVGSTALSITGTFTTQYLLTTASAPSVGGSASPSSGYYTQGTQVPVSASPNAGYSFTNWSGACSGSAACTVTMSAPKSVTANFTLITYPVTVTVPAGVAFNLNGTTYVTTATVSLVPGNYTLSTTSPQSTGAGVQAAFVSWSDSGALSHQISVAAPVNITGTFKTQYTLSATPVPAAQGSVALFPPAATSFYDAGSAVVLTATANPGYLFESWSGACSGSATTCLVIMSAPTSVTANFSIPPLWVQLFPPTNPNSYGLGDTLAYDSARQQTVLFTGSSQAIANQTWTFDGNTWTPQSPATSPPFRAFQSMAYDPSGPGQVVLFGGVNLSNLLNEVHLSDTWTWNGTTWAQKSPATHPSGRQGHAMAYDVASGETILFGGWCSQTCTGYYGDTWAWNGTTWTQKFPAHSPSPRKGHAMAYDSLNHVIVLFGGNNGSTTYGDTWLWNGVDWVQQSPVTSAFPVYFHVMAYDAALQQTVLFGGTTTQGGIFNGTWIWDGSNWLNRTPNPLTHPSPTPRASAGFAFDALHQQSVLFGGSDGLSSLNDTWAWLVPSINVVPQAPALARDLRGNYQVQITIKNQSNVPLTSISLTGAKLGTASATSFIGATTRTNVPPGGTTSFIAVFPIASVPGKTAGVSYQGVYSAATVVGAPWSGAVRSVVLP